MQKPVASDHPDSPPWLVTVPIHSHPAAEWLHHGAGAREMNIFEEQETYLWVTYSGFPHKPRNIHPLSLTDSQYLYSNMQQPQQHPELAPGTQTNARLCLLGDLGNSLLILQSTLMAGHLQVKEQFSPILVVHGACTRSDTPLALSSARDKPAHHHLWPVLPLPSTSPPLA